MAESLTEAIAVAEQVGNSLDEAMVHTLEIIYFTEGISDQLVGLVGAQNETVGQYLALTEQGKVLQQLIASAGAELTSFQESLGAMA